MERPPGVDGVSILNVLALWPCARAIFEHVSVRDLVRSERVSRRWQHAVHDYLQATRNLKLYYGFFEYLNEDDHRSIEVEKEESHWSVLSKTLEKLGVYVVSVHTDSNDAEHLRIIESNCRQLQYVGLYDEQPDLLNRLENFEILKKITSLGLNSTPNLGAKEFEYIASNLQNLTSLEVDDNGVEILKNIHELLFRMPQLENLSLRNYKSIASRKELVASLSQLSNLKRLDMTENENVDDELIEVVVRDCRKLEYLNITDAYHGCVRALPAVFRRPPPAVTTLFMGYIKNFTDEFLVQYIRCLFPIKELEDDGRVVLTPQWLEATARASQGRQYPLKLSTKPSRPSAQAFNELKIVLCSTNMTMETYVIVDEVAKKYC